MYSIFSYPGFDIAKSQRINDQVQAVPYVLVRRHTYNDILVGKVPDSLKKRNWLTLSHQDPQLLHKVQISSFQQRFKNGRVCFRLWLCSLEIHLKVGRLSHTPLCYHIHCMFINSLRFKISIPALVWKPAPVRFWWCSEPLM